MQINQGTKVSNHTSAVETTAMGTVAITSGMSHYRPLGVIYKVCMS